MFSRFPYGPVLSFLAALSFLGPAGCGGGSTSDSSVPRLTEAEATEFAASVEAAATDSQDALLALFDLDRLVEIAAEGLNLSSVDLELEQQGFRESSARPKTISGMIHRAVSEGGSYRFVRFHQKGEENRLLFRLLSDELGLHYLDLILSRDSGGRIKIVDAFMFWLDAKMSESWRQHLLLPLAVRDGKMSIEELSPAERAICKHRTAVFEFMKLSGQEDLSETKRAFEALPPELQQDKYILIWRMQACDRYGDDDDYATAVEANRDRFPSIPCLDCWLSGYFSITQQFAEARAAIDRFDRTLGGDPYLDVWRDSLYRLEGNYAAAREAIGRAIAAEPNLDQTHWAMVDVLCAERKFDEVLQGLIKIDKQFSPKSHKLPEDEDYAEFVKSSQHQAWLDYLKGR